MFLNKLQDSDLLHQACYIDGSWCNADNNAILKVCNPATGEVLGTVPAMGYRETCRAIEAANKSR